MLQKGRGEVDTVMEQLIGYLYLQGCTMEAEREASVSWTCLYVGAV